MRIIYLLVLLVISPGFLYAQLGKYHDSSKNKKIESINLPDFYENTVHEIINHENHKITLKTKNSFLVNETKSAINEMLEDYVKLYGQIDKINTKIFLIDEDEFFSLTGAPYWTNAIYYRNKILIPINNEKLTKPDLIIRTIKHEFSHALVNALTDGNCPGWLDEGLAQLAEDHDHSELLHILKEWSHKNEVIDLALLQDGFTVLDQKLVAPAYAQSLYASDLLIDSTSIESLANYFHSLKKSDDSDAFHKSFGFSEKSFKKILDYKIRETDKELEL